MEFQTAPLHVALAGDGIAAHAAVRKTDEEKAFLLSIAVLRPANVKENKLNLVEDECPHQVPDYESSAPFRDDPLRACQ
jgi:hypothetical protein